MAKEKIHIFKCPYWGECYNEVAQSFYSTETSVVVEAKPCKHPFLTHDGGIICGLDMETDGNYDKIIKQLKLYKPTLKGRVKTWLHTRKTKI